MADGDSADGAGPGPTATGCSRAGFIQTQVVEGKYRPSGDGHCALPANENNASRKLTGPTYDRLTYLTADEATDSGPGRINGKFKVEIEAVCAGYPAGEADA